MITIRSIVWVRFAMVLPALGFSTLATAAHCTDMTAPEIRLDPQIKIGGNN